MEKLDLTSFEKALNSLKEVIEVYNSDKKNLITRDSMIQRYEYTYSSAFTLFPSASSFSYVFSLTNAVPN